MSLDRVNFQSAHKAQKTKTSCIGQAQYNAILFCGGHLRRRAIFPSYMDFDEEGAVERLLPPAPLGPCNMTPISPVSLTLCLGTSMA
jgi:hypothetical protein